MSDLPFRIANVVVPSAYELGKVIELLTGAPQVSGLCAGPACESTAIDGYCLEHDPDRDATETAVRVAVAAGLIR